MNKNSAPVLVLMVSFLVLAVPSAAELVVPKPVETKSPEYPEELTSTGVGGMTLIDVLVRKDGTATDPVVKSADHPEFGEAAKAVIVDWKFNPAMQDGRPIEMRVAVPFQFWSPIWEQINRAMKREVFTTLPEPALSELAYGKELKVKKKAQSMFPRSQGRARVSRVEVKVLFVVAPDGSVINPRFEVPPQKELVLQAFVAAARMKFRPPVKDGKGVYVEGSTVLRFQPPGRGTGGRGRRNGGDGND